MITFSILPEKREKVVANSFFSLSEAALYKDVPYHFITSYACEDYFPQLETDFSKNLVVQFLCIENNELSVRSLHSRIYANYKASEALNEYLIRCVHQSFKCKCNFIETLQNFKLLLIVKSRKKNGNGRYVYLYLQKVGVKFKWLSVEEHVLIKDTLFYAATITD